MNTTARTLAAIVISLSAAGAAVAQEATYEVPQAIGSQTTRAAVLAELQQARADGSFQISEAHVGVTHGLQSQRSRAEVRAETLAALNSGDVMALTAEPSGFAPLQRRSVTATLVAGR